MYVVRTARIILVGAATGIVLGLLTLLVEFGLLMSEATSIMAGQDSGLGASSRITVAPYVTLVGFLLGALWQYKRS
jgi:hypothetical protein